MSFIELYKNLTSFGFEKVIFRLTSNLLTRINEKIPLEQNGICII